MLPPTTTRLQTGDGRTIACFARTAYLGADDADRDEDDLVHSECSREVTRSLCKNTV